MTSHQSVGESIRDVETLEDLLSEPTAEAVETLGRLEGDLILLGCGGKMGPSLARMARRASDLARVERRVIAVSRFTDPAARERLEAAGVETFAADLLDPRALAELPDAALVVWMAGRKFGTTEDRAATWALNVVAPAFAAERWAGARWVAFSTGNVYGLVPVDGGGSREDDPLRADGEYAMSAIGRERVFEHAGRRHGSPTAVLRLNYAVEMRYGVLHDLARTVASGEAVDVRMGAVNVIWQADANAAALRAFDSADVPPRTINVAGPEILSVRELAEELGRRLGVSPCFDGEEAPDALLSDGSLGRRLLGAPRVGADRVLRWVADWVRRGGESLDRPTHFDRRDGGF